MDAGSCSRQLHAAEGLDLENRAKLCSSSSLPSSLRKTSIRFCVDASDGSTRFAMSGVRSGVFLRRPSDTYAEPAGWLVWSLRSGRMAARVVYGLDGGLSAPAGHGGLLRRHAPHPALLAIKPVLLTSHVKSQCLNWSAVPVCRKLPESRRLRCGIEHMAMNAQPELATQNCRELARAANNAWMAWSRYPRPPRRAARPHLCIL